jgi:hypothetical protein
MVVWEVLVLLAEPIFLKKPAREICVLINARNRKMFQAEKMRHIKLQIFLSIIFIM